MTNKRWYLGLIVLLGGLPAGAADFSADFDRTQLPPEVVEQLALGPIDAYAMGMVHWWTQLREQGQLDEKSLREWVAEHDIGTDRLIRLLSSVSPKSLADEAHQPMCAVVYENLGADINTYIDLPPKVRLIMAIYLEGLGRVAGTKTLLSSVSELGQEAVSGILFATIGYELWKQRTGQHTAIWALKEAVQREEPSSRATTRCYEIMLACRQLGDPDVVREELIPWAEEALARPGSEAYLERALPALLWAYDYVGEPEKAIERGQYWFQQAEQRDVPPEKLVAAKRQLADVLTKTDQFERAAQIFTPEFQTVRPEQLGAWQQVSEQTTRTVLVSGNLTFSVTAASCELPSVTAVVGERQSDERERQSHYVIEITFGPKDKVGTYETTLVIETNDPENGVITVPIKVRVLAK